MSKYILPVVVAMSISVPVIGADIDTDSKQYLVNPVPSSWGYPGDSTISTSAAADNTWWRYFGDTTLDSLVDEALKANFDIASAVRRVSIARAAIGSARSAYYPNIGISAGWSRQQSSGMTGTPSTKAITESAFSLGATMSWEIDIFGKVATRVKSARAGLRASSAELASVRLSIVAQLVTAYIDLRMAQNELEVANEHAASQKAVMKIAEARWEAGIASMLDVAQARTVYYSTTAGIPLLDNTIHADINAIAVLLGTNPETLRQTLSEHKPMPTFNHLIQAGIPADLISRRPDIVQAQAQIESMAASLGIARKDYLPSLTLNGSIGTSAHDIGDMFGKQSLQYSIAPTLSWTVFDGLGRKYATAAAKANLQAAIDNYNLTVLNAYTETDNAIASYFNTLKYISSLDTVVAESARAEKLSIEKYKDGVAAFINVANAEMSYLENRNSLILAKGKAMAALVDIYKAVGGDFMSDKPIN